MGGAGSDSFQQRFHRLPLQSELRIPPVRQTWQRQFALRGVQAHDQVALTVCLDRAVAREPPARRFFPAVRSFPEESGRLAPEAGPTLVSSPLAPNEEPLLPVRHNESSW